VREGRENDTQKGGDGRKGVSIAKRETISGQAVVSKILDAKGVCQMKKSSYFKTVFALTLVFALFITASAFAQPWSFGVMADTQWTESRDDGMNPNTVAVEIIKQLNKEFINHNVEFVIQVGDLTDKGTNASTTITKTVGGVTSTYTTTNLQAIDTRAIFAQPLYNAGVGFFPLRGNHEDLQTTASEFVSIFPQTSGGQQNNTPSYVFAISNPDAATQPFPAKTGLPFTLGSNFSSPALPGMSGLSYSFDFGNARFVLLDQFTRTNGDGTGNANNNILDQLSWIETTLAGKPVGGHAFVFGHKNLIGENHTDDLFGANPSTNVAGQQSFFNSLATHGVRYYMSGHDHIHQRSIIKSPNDTPTVQEIICASNSSKFYVPLGNPLLPGTINNDLQWDVPVNGINNGPRETSIVQERNTIGYYIYSVDGPCVTVDYYSARAYPTFSSGEYLISTTPTLNFLRQETFGYCLNGEEFLVAQGQSYTTIQDSFGGTSAQILSGTNGNMATDGSLRLFTNAVDTGWSPKTGHTASDIFALWGMANSLGSDKTDVYTLSMSYDPKKANSGILKTGLFGLATRDEDGNWVNAADMNFGGTKKFVLGPWDPSYKLGTYGVDTSTHTVWAVINYNANFAAAQFRGGRPSF
jgi:hypothetical protein